MDWDRYLTAQDRDVVELSGFGRRGGLGERPALLVVDVTYAFCGDKPEPILESIPKFRNSCGEAAWSAVAAIQELIAGARSAQRPVIYSRGMGPSPSPLPGRWAAKNRRVVEQLSPAYHEVVDEIAPLPGDVVIRKMKPSAFFGTPLVSILNELEVDSLVVCGGTTSGCVRATVVDAFSYNLSVAVAADATFDRIEASHALSLFDMDLKYADVVKAADAVRALTDGHEGADRRQA